MGPVALLLLFLSLVFEVCCFCEDVCGFSFFLCLRSIAASISFWYFELIVDDGAVGNDGNGVGLLA